MDSQRRLERRRFLHAVSVTSLVGLLAGCTDGAGDGNGGDDGGDGGDTDENTVVVGPNGSFTFDPDSLTVSPGTEVLFVWDSGGHNLDVDSQPDGASWEGVGETQSSGFEHSHTFDTAGEYEYYCSPHQSQGMNGSITVEE